MMESTGMNKPGMPEPAENAKVPKETSTVAGSAKLSIEQLDEAAGGNADKNSVGSNNMGLDFKVSKDQFPGLLNMIFRIKGDADNR